MLTLHSDAHRPVSRLEEVNCETLCTQRKVGQRKVEAATVGGSPALSASTSLENLIEQGVNVQLRNRISECIDDLRHHRVDAISTDAATLVGYKAKFPKEFDHWDLVLDKTEAYGVNVGDSKALRKLVDLTLYRSYTDPEDTRWEQAYAANFQTEVDENGRTPIAVASQPQVSRPDVREMPWGKILDE